MRRLFLSHLAMNVVTSFEPNMQSEMLYSVVTMNWYAMQALTNPGTFFSNMNKEESSTVALCEKKDVLVKSTTAISTHLLVSRDTDSRHHLLSIQPSTPQNLDLRKRILRISEMNPNRSVTLSTQRPDRPSPSAAAIRLPSHHDSTVMFFTVYWDFTLVIKNRRGCLLTVDRKLIFFYSI